MDPHSLTRLPDGRIAMCESMQSALCIVEPATCLVTRVALRGYTRGIAHTGRHLVVGASHWRSRSRSSSQTRGLPSFESNAQHDSFRALVSVRAARGSERHQYGRLHAVRFGNLRCRLSGPALPAGVGVQAGVAAPPAGSKEPLAPRPDAGAARVTRQSRRFGVHRCLRQPDSPDCSAQSPALASRRTVPPLCHPSDAPA